jgi:hypothetical protein
MCCSAEECIRSNPLSLVLFGQRVVPLKQIIVIVIVV